MPPMPQPTFSSRTAPPRIAIVTCRVLPEPDPDQEPLLAALRSAGLGAELLAWDAPSADPSPFDLCVLRSCWNYFERPDEFVAWIDRAAAVSRVVNPPEVVRWNLHKSYLAELEAGGVPIVPTVWFERGERADLRATLDERGWTDVVIKPTVSAASFSTRRFSLQGAEEELGEGQRFLESLVAERDTMVQRYMPTVETSGERALVWIDGRLTHAVRKSPRFDDGVEQVSGALPVSAAERRIAEAALRIASEAAAVPLLYGRVDVMQTETGGEDALAVSELELMEPSLFLLQSPEALDRFVAALRRAVS